jgi:cytoskeleton protein RodZ
VAGRLKFAPRQITALEEGNFAQLPEMAFVRGFVRSYAKLLQLDAEPLLDALPSAPAQQVALPEKKSAGEPFPGVYAMRMPNILWLAGALGIALVIGILAWQHDGGQVTPKPAAAAKPAETTKIPVVAEPAVPAVAPPTVAPVAAPKTAESAAHKHPARLLRLAFDEDSWVEVKDGNGKILLSLMGVRGSEQGVNGTPPFAVTIGNAAGVRLYYKGNPVDLVPHTEVDVARLTLE